MSSFREDGFFLMKNPVSGAASIHTIPENALALIWLEKGSHHAEAGWLFSFWDGVWEGREGPG